MSHGLVVLILVFFVALASVITFSLVANKNKYEIFHYKHTYSDGSQNDMICIFDQMTGEWRVEPLQ